VEEEGPSSKHTIFSSSGGGVPIKRRLGYIYPPTWLRSNSQLYTMPPIVAVDSLGVHILDQGYGAHTLLTVRQIDGEKQKKLTLEQQARAGVLGRIVSGVWVKLAEVSGLFLIFLFFGIFDILVFLSICKLVVGFLCVFNQVLSFACVT